MQKIVVTNAATMPDGTWTITCVLWLSAPSNSIVPHPGFKSRVLNVPSDVQAALEAGTLVEQMQTSGQFPASYGLADAHAELEAIYAREQSELDATNPPIAGLVGTRWDGTSWVVG